MTFPRYYRPACRVVAAGLEIVNLDGEGLRIKFDVTRTLQSTPDVARLQVWGLSRERKVTIREVHRLTGALPLEIWAGWDLVPLLLFTGQGVRVTVDLSDDMSQPGLIVEAGDGIDGYSSAILEFATYGITLAELVTNYAAPALVEPVPGLPAVTFPSSTLKVSPTAIATLNAAGAVTLGTFTQGYAFAGTGRELMDEICRTIGAKWWISNGILEVLSVREAIPGPALILRPSSGLLAHSLVEDLGDFSGRALLDPAAVPGRLIVPQDDNGVPLGEPAYRLEEVRFAGDTRTGPWSMDLVARSGGLIVA